MQNDNYSPYPTTPIPTPTPASPPEPAYPPVNVSPADTRNNKNLIMFGITLATLAIVGLIIFGTIILIKNIKGDSGVSDPNFVTIEFDGTKFKIHDTYGDTIREIAKQRTIYDWGGLMDHTYTEVTDIESYLDQYIVGNEEYTDGNDKNTIIKKDDSDFPDIFIEVDRTIAGLDEKSTKINDADVRVHVFPLSKATIEFKIDGNTLITYKTTVAEFKKMFKEAEEYISGDPANEGYTLFDFTYKKRRFTAAFNSDDTLYMLEIDTHTKG